MKRIIVCVMSIVLLMAWCTVTRAQTHEQRQGLTDGGDIAEAIAQGAAQPEQRLKLSPKQMETLRKSRQGAPQAEPTQPLSDWLSGLGKGSGEPSPPPGGTTQPWQTSWEAFCAELQRVYSQGVPPPEKIDALFAGKQVTWEGNIAQIEEGKELIRVRMTDCRVPTGPDRILAQVVPPLLIFENQSEMNQSFNQLGLGDPESWGQKMLQSYDFYDRFTQKVRFTLTLEPLDLGAAKFPAVSWEHFTDEKTGSEGYQIHIYTGSVRLLVPASDSSRKDHPKVRR